MPDRSVVLAVRHRDVMIDVRRRVSTRVRDLWDNLGGYDRADVPRFTAAATAVVDAGQRRTVAVTAAYLARLSGSRAFSLDTSSLVGAAVRNGADPADVYRRPFLQVWSALSDGTPFADAVDAAGARVAATADTDVTLSMRAAADAAADEFERRVVGWERVLDPDACAFCAAASTQRYTTANLDPLHPSCQCGIAPVFAENDRAIRKFNKDLLANIKAANKGKGAPYWKARHFRVDGQTGEVVLPEVAVHTHGELGAVVTDAAHTFSGPASVAG